MKVRYDESFLFPQSQVDFNRGAINFPQGLLHGVGGLNAVSAGPKASLLSPQQIQLFIENPRAACQAYNDYEASLALLDPDSTYYDLNVQSTRDKMQEVDYYCKIGSQNQAAQQAAAQAAAQQAAAQQAAAAQAAAAQAAAQQAAAAQAAAQQAAAQQAAAAQAAAQTSAAATTKTVPQRVIDFDTAIMALKSYGKYIEGMSAQQMTAALNALSDGNATFLVPERTGAAAAPSAPAATSTTMATNTSTVGYDLAVSLLKAAGKYTAGMTEQQMATALTALEGNPVFVMTPAATATAIAATKTQTTATNTATGTVQTTDKVSGTTSTVNAATGAVTVTTATGQTASGTGTVAAGGVITTVDPKAGVVTTQNTQTGVVTQTDAATGKTVTATQITGSAGGGGTFMLPDQKTVSTATAITSTGGLDSGKIALFGLIGLLLLRGAVR